MSRLHKLAVLGLVTVAATVLVGGRCAVDVFGNVDDDDFNIEIDDDGIDFDDKPLISQHFDLNANWA